MGEPGNPAVRLSGGSNRYRNDHEPNIRLELPKRIANKVSIPLVLHGGSGISDDDFRRAVKCGIAKINFYTEMARKALLRTEEFIKGVSNYYNSFDSMNQVIKDTVREVVEERIVVFGSSHKA